MSSHEATVKILECIVLWCVLVAVGTQARTLPTIRKHHHTAGIKHPTGLDVEHEASIEYRNDAPIHRPNGKLSKHRGSDDDDDSFYEETRSLRLMENEDSHPGRMPTSFRRSHAIRKRHNGVSHRVSYATLSDANLARFMNGRSRGLHHRGTLESLRNELYQVEIREAQNSSVCNYTVKEIPDMSEDQSRTPKNLVNVMCNHAGSDCRHGSTARPYCCIQTYSKIDVTYSNDVTETIKIYTGCVCSLSLIAAIKPISAGHRIND